jgi:hypothetical protein
VDNANTIPDANGEFIDRDAAAESLPFWLTTCDCGACTYEKGEPNPCECAQEVE